MNTVFFSNEPALLLSGALTKTTSNPMSLSVFPIATSYDIRSGPGASGAVTSAFSPKSSLTRRPCFFSVSATYSSTSIPTSDEMYFSTNVFFAALKFVSNSSGFGEFFRRFSIE